MLTERTRLCLASDVSRQSMGPSQETVILSFDSGYLYTGNETTEEFLKGLDGKRTLGEIIDQLERQYDVSREELARDLTRLAEELLREKLAVEQRE